MNGGDGAERRRYSGRRVVLLILIIAPLICVPLLLAGTSSERQVDLSTLRQRQRSAFVFGSFPITSNPWQPVAEWPELPTRVRLADAFTSPAAATPDEYLDALGARSRPQPQWITVSRTMPFAFVFPIRNSRVMTAPQQDLYAIRLAAFSVLDPASEQDRQCLGALDAAIFSGPEQQNAAAAALLLDELVAAETAANPRAAGRKALCAFGQASESEE